MKDTTVEQKFGHYEVRVNGDFVSSAETYEEALAEAEAYLQSGEKA